MTTKMISLFALCVLLGAVMLACGGAADNTNTATTNANANTNANTKTAATPATTTATPAGTSGSTGGDIGVAACDDFLKKYEACVSGKVPAAAQATFKTSLDTWRSSWKQLAGTPQGKAGLETACKSALEQAKTSLSSYGCTW
ncbi:MAG TPA: hypothetical protein VN282_16850 [Pyrinomonadaceae bacterium]|nr:hypothetical protein [Pyrinomonadaceae bacterium]